MRCEEGFDAGSPPQEAAIRLRDHPRARRQIDLARGWGGIAAFALVAATGPPRRRAAGGAGLRALLGGVLGYVACWGLAVMVWRHLAVAEEAAARASAERRRAALLEEIERRAAGGAEEARLG